MRLYFVLICEGPSDQALVSHLQRLCLKAGADEVEGAPTDFSHLDVGKSLREKLQAAMKHEESANLFFLHRDADARDHRPRRKEVTEAIDANEPSVPCVAVIPVQEIEAWLLLDEMAIRRVAGNPKGKFPLKLPAPSAVERLASPKEILQAKLFQAFEQTSPRRLKKFKALFNTHRRILLEELPIGGRLDKVPAWTRLREDIRGAIASMSMIETLEA
jgi:Domain of unknown function (DUF4276)